MDSHTTDDADTCGTVPEMLGAELDESTLTLLLWGVALRLKPPQGWFRATGISEEELLQLAKDKAAAMTRLRVLLAVGRLTDDEELSVLLKARLAERLLSAVGVKELVEAARLIQKSGSAPSAQPARAIDEPGATDDEELGDAELDAAIAEVRRLLAELERLPTPEQLVAATEAALDTGVLDDAETAAEDVQ